MTVVLATLVIMAVSIALIYRLTNYFGFRLKLVSLILCAIMAFAVNFAAIMLSPYLTEEHYIRLGVLVTIAAALVTICNEFLLKREEDRLALQNDILLVPLTEAEAAMAEISPPAEETSDAGKKSAAEENTDTAPVDNEADGAKEKAEPTERKEKEKSDAVGRLRKKILERAEKVKTLQEESERLAEKGRLDALADKRRNEIIEKEMEEKAEAERKKREEEARIRRERIEKLRTDTERRKREREEEKLRREREEKERIEALRKKREDEKQRLENEEKERSLLREQAAKQEEEKRRELEKKKRDEEKRRELERKAREEAAAREREEREEKRRTERNARETEAAKRDIAAFSTLDEFLDYAFSQKSAGNMMKAVAADREALERYRGDDYAPFIAIDLGNIYKEIGDYDAAIASFEKALGLPAVSGNVEMQREFRKNISYLRVVKSTLSRHDAAKTPFARIPAEFMREIENNA